MAEARRGERDQRKSHVRGSKRTIFWRTVILMCLMGVILFIPLFRNLWKLSVVEHDHYQQLATQQQTMDLSMNAARGNIYDRNGNVMAMSATVYDLIVSPRDLVESVDKKDFTNKEDVLDEAAYKDAVAAKQDKTIRDLLTLVPGLDPDKVTKQVMDVDRAYKEVKKSIPEEDAEGLRAYIADNETAPYLYLKVNSKRYYPYSGLAAQALGFVNAEGGAYGIEAIYDDVLKGSPGRVVTTKTAKGTEMFDSYSEFVDAEDGLNLTLTIDATIQSYVEKTLEEGIEEFDVRNGAFGIAMDPKTGAILAIASAPEFDPNEYSTVTDPVLLRQMETDTERNYKYLREHNEEGLTEGELMDKAKAQAYSKAVNTQWRSKAIDSRYEPGSTYKVLTLASALEEGVVTESDTFMCTGSARVEGWDKPIHCARHSGHGLQNLAEATRNSCNPAFMEIGRRVGIDRYQDYFEAFGFKEPTGIDLPGEASMKDNIWDRDEMTAVDLAVGSFGQRVEVTPIQMITALASTINGGKLMQPYVVQSVSDKNGTIVHNTEPTVVRQVISEETSQRVVKILESVVYGGTGKSGYVPGYRIGGKTGSSETQEKDHTIVSFMAFAPAEDPQVIVLMAYDKPQPKEPGSKYSTTGVYISGAYMTAKKTGPMVADILDYLGVEKQYNQEESAAVDTKAPSLIGRTVRDAAEVCLNKHLNYRTVGEGDVVKRQVPGQYTVIPGGTTMVLYLGDEVPPKEGTIPNVVGLSYEAAKKQLDNAGFLMKAGGVSKYYGNTTIATAQSIPAGEAAKTGTTVKVDFTNTTGGEVEPLE